MSAGVLYTAGYEGLSMEAFLWMLQEAGVRMLIDVREVPSSRKPGFSKTSLKATIENASMVYDHFRELGCPKVIRDTHREDGDWEKYTTAYLRHLKRQGTTLRRLAQLATQSTTAVLCYEADFQRCHRTYVARAVCAIAPLRIMHLTATGAVQDEAPALLAS